MNNLSSYYGLTDSRMSASEKDLPVLDMKYIFFSCKKGEEPVDKEVLKSDLNQIENLLIILQDLMCENDKSSENYQNLLLKLPIDYANEYHYLIQWSAVYGGFQFLDLIITELKSHMTC